MDRQSELEFFDSTIEPDASSPSCEFRIYRPNGSLSVIYFTAFESDQRAISEAEKIARTGYLVDVWRSGARIDRVSGHNVSDTGRHGPHLQER
jgi:hypothetical protein